MGGGQVFGAAHEDRQMASALAFEEAGRTLGALAAPARFHELLLAHAGPSPAGNLVADVPELHVASSG
jgi:hypothetical protein